MKDYYLGTENTRVKACGRSSRATCNSIQTNYEFKQIGNADKVTLFFNVF